MHQDSWRLRETCGWPEVALADLDHILFREELDIERTGDPQRAGDLTGDGFHCAHGLHVELLSGEHERRVARVTPAFSTCYEMA